MSAVTIVVTRELLELTISPGQRSHIIELSYLDLPQGDNAPPQRTYEVKIRLQVAGEAAVDVLNTPARYTITGFFYGSDEDLRARVRDDIVSLLTGELLNVELGLVGDKGGPQ